MKVATFPQNPEVNVVGNVSLYPGPYVKVFVYLKESCQLLNCPLLFFLIYS